MEPMTPAEGVAAKVRAELARQQKTRKGLKDQLGISKTAFYRRISGDLPFDVNQVVVVADYLGVEVADLFAPAA